VSRTSPVAWGAWLSGALLLAIVASGCTRSLRGTDEDGDAVSDGGASALTSELIEIEVPEADARVASPAEVAGSVELASGQLAVAQVLRDAEGASAVRLANLSLDVQADGSFEASLPFELDETDRGRIEVVIVDAASGTIVDRASSPVELMAAP